MVWVAVSPARAWAEARWSGLADTIFQALGTHDGLPNAGVFSVAEDGTGFVWLGTSDGLVRWDGYRFRVFRPVPHDPDSLPDNLVQLLFKDPAGRLWVGTATGGLTSYDSGTEKFHTYGIDGQPTGRMEVRAICDDGAGGLWVGGGGGLYHLGKGEASLHPATFSLGSEGTQRVLALLRDRSGALWVGATRGLYRRAPGAQAFTAMNLAGKPSTVVVLAQDGSGAVWAGTAGFGAFRVTEDGKTAHQLTQTGAEPHPQLQTLDVEAMTEARPGEMWLGTTGNGIVAVNEADLSIRRIRHDSARPTSLADDTVWALFKDSGGMVWVGTASGFSHADPSRDAILTLFGVRGQQGSISDADVSAVMAAPDGRIWVGLSHGGLNIIDPAALHITNLASGGAFPDAIVDALAAAPDGSVFAGSWRGLYHADASGQTIAPIKLPGDAPFVAVTALAEQGGSLWIGKNAGVDRLAPTAGAEVQPVLDHRNMHDPRAPELLPDPDGKLWIGGWTGVSLFDPATGQVTQMQNNPADPSSLAPGATTALLVGRRHRLWVGSAGGGISILTGYRAGKPHFRHLGTADGLPNPNVDGLVQAQDGQIWCSTDDGLARIDPDTLSITAFHLADGVVIPDYWAGSAAVSSAGELLFGGQGGLTVVRPDRLVAPPGPKRMVVTDVKLGGKTISAGQFNHGAAGAVLEVQPDANSIAIEFSALDYVDAARDQYAYRLVGFDKDWIETDPSRRVAAYDNLPPGSYILRARVLGPSGRPAGAVLEVPIRVLPAWYQTLWFRAAVGLLSIAGIMLVLRMQTMRLRGRQRELEQLVTRRTAQLSQSNQALTQAAATLGDLSLIGRQLTANLDIDRVLALLHSHVGRLLDAPYFAIYLLQKHGGEPVLRFGMQDGQSLSGTSPPSAAHEPFIRRAMQIVPETDIGPHLAGADNSLLCGPLIALDRVIGVMLIQSPRAGAYGERDELIFRTLCAYGAIALGNAETLEALADMRAQLEHLAYTDGLTNLPNRRVYNAEFDRFAARWRAGGEHFALLLIDVDSFKEINDNYGHDAGDALLAATALRLQESVRGSDIVIRLGGDEFAILLSDVMSQPAVEHACQRISVQFANGLSFKGVTIESTVSIGVALFPADGDTQEQLYKAADLALYDAKRAGRNTWRRHRPAQPVLAPAD
jgi:diguanylate cyclase (GGDEF)-like protein